MKPRTTVKAKVLLLVVSLIVVFTISALLVKGLQAKELTVGTIEYKITAFTICNSLEDGDTVKLKSGGGSVLEAMEIAACLRKKDVTVKVEKALSAATFLVLAGKEVCFPKEALIGFHSPHSYSPKGLMVMSGINELRDYSRFIGHKMNGWGYNDVEIYAVLGVTMYTPSNDMTMLPYKTMIVLLGDRFIGDCK